MRVVIGDILPLALVVTVSPLNIIPVILLLFTKRPVLQSSLFLGGFTVGVAVVLGGAVALASALEHSPRTDGDTRLAAIVKLLLGCYLLWEAVQKFRNRPHHGETGPMPAWMDGISGFSPGRSLAVGLVLGAANPKNIVVGVAAATTIATAGLPVGQQVGAIAVYVLVAVLGVATPIVVTLFLGDRAPEVLRGWNAWLGQNNATVMAVLFLVFGVVLVGQGIGGI